MNTYDKRKSRQSFDRAAHHYDESAHLQQHVASKLVSLHPQNAFQDILDIGCGTGQVIEEISHCYPHANLVALDFSEKMLNETRKRLLSIGKKADLVCADAEFLPFDDKSFDLVLSSLMLQWSNDLTKNLNQIHCCLKEKGQFAFSTFTDGTLKEVQGSWSAVDSQVHTSHFMALETLHDAVKSAGFSQVHIEIETIVYSHSDVRDVLMSMKRIGASNSHNMRNKGLTGKQRFAAFEAAYEIFRHADRTYPCTWELAYVFCDK